MPDTTTVNLDEIKSISRTLLLSELIEKTKRCALTWVQIANGRYMATMLPFDFYVSKLATDSYSLDVQKNASFYRTYNSYTQPEVKDLYVEVDTALRGQQEFSRVRDAMSALGRLSSCIKPKTQSLTLYGRVKVGGAAFSYTGITLTPTAITSTGLTSGTVADIDERVDSHDSNATKVLIDYTGVQNPDYMMVKIEFNQSQIPVLGTYNMIRCRVVVKSDDVDDINMVLDYSINDTSTPSGLGYAGFPDITGSFAIIDSDFHLLPTTMAYGDFTTPLVLWFYIVPVTVGHGTVQITAADITLAKA
jgi:hypothetical protein